MQSDDMDEDEVLLPPIKFGGLVPSLSADGPSRQPERTTTIPSFHELNLNLPESLRRTPTLGPSTHQANIQSSMSQNQIPPRDRFNRGGVPHQPSPYTSQQHLQDPYDLTFHSYHVPTDQPTNFHSHRDIQGRHYRSTSASSSLNYQESYSRSPLERGDETNAYEANPPPHLRSEGPYPAPPPWMMVDTRRPSHPNHWSSEDLVASSSSAPTVIVLDPSPPARFPSEPEFDGEPLDESYGYLNVVPEDQVMQRPSRTRTSPGAKGKGKAKSGLEPWDEEPSTSPNISPENSPQMQTDTDLGFTTERAKPRTRKTWHEWEKTLLKNEFEKQVQLTGHLELVDWNVVIANIQQVEQFKRTKSGILTMAATLGLRQTTRALRKIHARRPT